MANEINETMIKKFGSVVLDEIVNRQTCMQLNPVLTQAVAASAVKTITINAPVTFSRSKVDATPAVL